MAGQHISITFSLTLVLLIVSLPFGFTWSLLGAEGQAEETFGQNTTFFEEIEQKQNSTGKNLTNDTHSLSSATHEQLNESLTAASSNDIDELRPQIYVSGDNAYVVWLSNKTGNLEVMLRASNDNGETFGEKINLSNSSQTDSENADIAASASEVFVVWNEINRANGTGTGEPVLRISNNSGLTFGPGLDLFANGTIGEKQTFSEYVNTTYGVRMQYPVDWQVRIGGDNTSSVIDIAGFVSPAEYRLDKYKEKVWISLDSLRSENMTLGEYSDQVVNYKNQSLRNFQLLDYDTDSIILAGHPAYRLVYTGTLEDGMIIKQMEIGTKIGDKVYYLDYYAEEEKYPDFLPTIQDMINSLVIEDN